MVVNIPIVTFGERIYKERAARSNACIARLELEEGVIHVSNVLDAQTAWLFPSTFGMNGYVSITAMGCSLSDISTKCIALALQSIAYFTVYALFFCRKPCR